MMLKMGFLNIHPLGTTCMEIVHWLNTGQLDNWPEAAKTVVAQIRKYVPPFELDVRSVVEP